MGRVTNLALRLLYDAFVEEVNSQYKKPLPNAIDAGLTKLTAELDKLHDSWSAMASRNIMADIVRLLASMEAVLTDDSKKRAIALKQQFDKMLGSHSPSKARYSSALCIGYKTKTTFPQGYQGLPDDRQDMEAKVADMKKAIQQARTAVDARNFANPESMLKIFMAPEFFFRGQRGAYSFDDVNGEKGKKSLAALLLEEIDNPVYKDWLFVLGTVIAASNDMRTLCTQGCTDGIDFVKDPKTGKTNPVCKKVPGHTVKEYFHGAQVDNVAIIIKEKYVHTVAKELVSNQDYIPTPDPKYANTVIVDGAIRPVNFTWQNVGGAPTAENKPAKFTDERMGGNIFTVDGVTFGCEVCLDHGMSSSTTTAGRLEHASNIQIQLIPSAGQHIKQLRTVDNGVVFNVDGATPHVEAYGLQGPDLRAYKSYTNASRAAPKTWDEAEKYAAGLVQLKELQGVAPLASPGLSGAVVQYGPFEIPQV